MPESNTDRAIKEILEHTGLDYDLIKLSNMHLEPCRACSGCNDDNSCRIMDNGRVLAERFAKVRGFVVGGYTSYGSLDSRTKMWMERMYCLRHVRSMNKGKFGVIVLTTAGHDDHDADMARRQIEMWMDEEGMVCLGSMVVSGSGPCVRCGNQRCISRVRQPGTAPLAEVSDPNLSPGDLGAAQMIALEPTVLTRAAELGQKLRDAVLAETRPTNSSRGGDHGEAADAAL